MSEEAKPEYSKLCRVTTEEGRTFLARYIKDASMYFCEEKNTEVDCDQWQAEESEVIPECWSGGASWHENEEGIMSDQVEKWEYV